MILAAPENIIVRVGKGQRLGVNVVIIKRTKISVVSAHLVSSIQLQVIKVFFHHSSFYLGKVFSPIQFLLG